MSDITANRFTDEDRERMRARVLDTLAKWDDGIVQLKGRGHRYQVKLADTETLERLAYHAIGCDARDLRDSELDEIRDMVRTVVAERS